MGNFKKIFLLIFLFFTASNVNAQGIYDRVLVEALKTADIEKAENALLKGADIKNINPLTNGKRRTLRIEHLPLKSLEFLISKDYDINNTTDNEGCILAHVMSHRGYDKDFQETVDLLIKNGANNCIYRGRTLLGLVTNYSFTSDFRRKVAQDKATYMKAYQSIVDSSTQLSAWSRRSSSRNYYNSRPIHFADAEQFEILIKKGATLNGTNKTRKDFVSDGREDDIGLTALKKAINLNRVDLVKLVLDHGADINEVQRGMTALDYAKDKQLLEIEVYLFERGGQYHRYK